MKAAWNIGDDCECAEHYRDRATASSPTEDSALSSTEIAERCGYAHRNRARDQRDDEGEHDPLHRNAVELTGEHQEAERGQSSPSELCQACSMASANLELVRSIYADWERGDYSSAQWAHPMIEFIWADGPEPGEWKGLAEMAQSMRNWLSAWEEVHVEADEYCELDDGRVLVLAHHGGRGKTSGLEIGQATAKKRDSVPHPRRQGDEARPLLGPRARVC